MSFPFLSDVVLAITGLHLPLPLPMFGLFVALATLVAALCLKYELRPLYNAGQIGMATVRSKGKGGTITEERVLPQSVVADLITVVLPTGIIGARLFHLLENFDQFLAHPGSMIFTTSGVSIFGGLTFGTLTGIICIKRWKLPIRPILDAVAPAMMLGYAVGRVGCQIAGDGDWGIASNLAIKPDWLPMWTWAQTYQNNIAGTLIPAPGVYPTPLYETIMSLICFAILWRLRKHPHQMGWLFSMYLLLAGIERLLIEQIRINPLLDVAGVHVTQAELISIVIIALGGIGLVMLTQKEMTGIQHANQK